MQLYYNGQPLLNPLISVLVEAGDPRQQVGGGRGREEGEREEERGKREGRGPCLQAYQGR
jgi:hypothetical protein